MDNTNAAAAPKVAKIVAFRNDTFDKRVKVIHRGILQDFDFDGTPLYRLSCQGRNVRYLTRAVEEVQAQAITCKKCGGRS